jgi:hypothetical protein
LGCVTARGLTHRFFLERQTFEFFLAIKEFKRRCICLKGAGRAFAGAYTKPRPSSSFWLAYFEQLFSGWGWGVVQKSGIFKRGPQGSPARIAAKFRKIFFARTQLGNPQPRRQGRCKNCREIQGGGVRRMPT